MSSNKMNRKVHYADLWGSRQKKYDWLEKHDIGNTDWQELKQRDPYFFLVPKNEEGWDLYQKFIKITDIFPVNSVGIVTARDNLTIHWTEEEAWNTVLAFSSMEPELARSAYKLGEDAKDWTVLGAQKDLRESGLDRSRITPILYRPFDIRYTYYTGKSRGFHCRPRPEVMRNMLNSNISLVVCRQALSGSFSHVLMADKLVESCFVSNKTKEIGYVFPLYIFSNRDQQNFLEEERKSQNTEWEKLPSSTQILQPFTTQNGDFILPEKGVFYYIYAILYSNIYRQKYQEFLKIDFPRIPFTSNNELLKGLARWGKELVDLHLLKSDTLKNSKTKFEGENSNLVEEVRFSTGWVWINGKQFFANIPEEVWNYQIGGYQVLAKWLKDRKGRILSSEEVKTYCKIVTVLTETIKVQKEIDKLYPEVETSLAS